MMLYTPRKPILPSNFGRAAHVRRMSVSYEQAAILRSETSIESAGFEIVYYQRKKSGTQCFCTTSLVNIIRDPLTPDGVLTSDSINQIVRLSPVANYGEDPDISFSVKRYTSNEEKQEAATPPVNDDTGTRETLHTSLLDDDDLDDENDDFIVPQFSPSIANCPVCARTGFVGGFERWGGARIVYAAPHFAEALLENLTLDGSKQPCRQLTPLGDQPGRLEMNVQWPAATLKIASFRIMNGTDELLLGDQIKLSIDNIQITNSSALLQFMDGFTHSLVLQVSSSLTHIELEVETSSTPLFVDVTNLNRVANYQSLNDFDNLNLIFPPRIKFIERGDVFFEKTTREGWVIIGSEQTRSPINSHGYSVQADRINTRYDQFSLVNPFK